MIGSFDKVSSSYDNLIAFLPNVLGKKLPTSLKKLGQFNLVGDAKITTKSLLMLILIYKQNWETLHQNWS